MKKENINKFKKENCINCSMNSLCFQGADWEELCERYIKFNKMVDIYEPGALDLMMKNDEYKEIKIKKSKKNKKQRTRALRRKNDFKKNERRKKIALQGNGYNPMRGYINYEYIDGKWVPVGKYVKYIGKSNGQRYLKNKTNKRLRKISIDEEEKGYKGNGYRRESGVDYWWELY